MGKKRRHPSNETTSTGDANDWISALAKQVTEGSSSSLPSKAERIERRTVKKQRRRERCEKVERESVDRKIGLSTKGIDDGPSGRRKSTRRSRMSEVFIAQLESILRDRCEHNSTSPRGKIPYVPEQKKGKAVKGQITEENVQPQNCSYGGLGLARPSLWVGLSDPSFVPKVEESFSEHVNGFFGKQRTKAMKRQLDGNMLWRVLAEQRVNITKVKGKKLSDMSPDERVEVLLEAGLPVL